MRSAATFSRNHPRFAPQQRVLILCEDTHSSLQYMQKAAQALRASADVKISHCGKNDPLGILNAAISDKKRYDRIYCLIDRDSHENFHEARKEVERHADKIELVISNPCFEYWLILHFRYTRTPYTNQGKKSRGDVAVSHLKKLDGMNDYKKGKTADLYQLLKDKLNIAEKNAAKSLQEAEDVQEYNPSTQVHLIISKFRELAAPR